MILVDYKLKMGQGYDLIPQNARTGLDCDNRKEEVETPAKGAVVGWRGLLFISWKLSVAMQKLKGSSGKGPHMPCGAVP